MQNHHHHHLNLKQFHGADHHTLALDLLKSRPNSRSHSRPESRSHSRSTSRSQSPCPVAPDATAVLSDELLLLILAQIPSLSRDSAAASLVCKRWLRLSGRLRRSLTLRNWSSLDCLVARFPNLIELDLVTQIIQAGKLGGGGWRRIFGREWRTAVDLEAATVRRTPIGMEERVSRVNLGEFTAAGKIKLVKGKFVN